MSGTESGSHSGRGRSVLHLIAAVAVCQLAGAAGALFMGGAPDAWYRSLAKPAFNPPGWVFGPVWFTLYTMMGVALFLVLRAPGPRRRALVAFGVQLVLNAFWTLFFFRLHAPGAAFVEIVVLWCAIVATIVLFHRISRAAAYLLIPYAAWVTFAAVLNFTLWRLNA